MAPWHGAGRAVALVAATLAVTAAQPQQGQGPPKWLDDEGKDLYTDLEAADALYSDAACETREKLLKKMAGKGDKDATSYRAMTLLGLGLCEFRKGSFSLSLKRIESAISEMNMPSEEIMLQNQHVAHIALLKQAASFMSKYEASQAGTALRRCREVIDRNVKKVVKMVHKQMGGQGKAPPVELLLDEVPGYGKTGQYLPTLMKQVPGLKNEFALAEFIDTSLDQLDKRIAVTDTTLKAKRQRLDVSKGKSKGGSLLFVRALPSEAVVPGERLAAAQELLSAGLVKVLEEETAQAEKGATLVDRAKEGSGCKEGKGFAKTCKVLMSVPDIASNGFGESRVLLVKAGKRQQLDACSTNANVGILVAAKEGVRATVAGAAEPVELQVGEPLVVDFCREVTLEAGEAAHVLFAQAWHPEFAAVERTTELRARSKAFGLDEEEVKAVTKVVNDHAKKGWDKAAARWRSDSEGLAAIRQAMEQEEQEKRQKEESAAEAKRKEHESGDDEKKKALEELERKREQKRLRAEQAEQARLRRKKQLEDERANRDPWLNSPSVLEAERKVEELKEARRDANAKLEFDLSTQLTKDISAAERALKKAIKQAKKDHKKGGSDGAAASAAAGEQKPAEEPEEAEEPPTKRAKAEEPAKASKKEESVKGAKDAGKSTKDAGKGTKDAGKGAKDAGKGKKDAAKGKESKELAELKKKLAEVVEKKKTAAEAGEYKEAKKLKDKQQELEAKIKKLEL